MFSTETDKPRPKSGFIFLVAGAGFELVTCESSVELEIAGWEHDFALIRNTASVQTRQKRLFNVDRHFGRLMAYFCYE